MRGAALRFKKFALEVGQNLLAHWVAAGIIALVALGLPYWAWISEHW